MLTAAILEWHTDDLVSIDMQVNRKISDLVRNIESLKCYYNQVKDEPAFKSIRVVEVYLNEPGFEPTRIPIFVRGQFIRTISR